MVTTKRLLSIDILRGFAMVLVILQHSYLLVDSSLIPSWLNFFVWNVTGMAAVAFVSISGAVFSYFLKMKKDWRITCRRYIPRAFFLLLVAHPIINIATYPFKIMGSNAVDSSWHYFLWRVFFGFPITDTIAVCILISPFFIIRLNRYRRAVVIVIILLSTPLVASLIVPVTPFFNISKECLFGKLGEPKLFWFPLLPWLAIFLSGSFVGERLACFKQGRIKAENLARQMNRDGVVLFVCSIILIVGYKVMKMVFQGSLSPDFFRAIAPSQMTGMLPFYFAFLLWVLAALIYMIEISGHYNRWFWFLSVFGRASLFTFIMQFVVVESIPAMLGFKGALGVTGYFVLFVVGSTVTWLLAYYYGRARGWFPVDDYFQHLQSCSA